MEEIKKLLIISNISIKITNFIIPLIVAAQHLGFEVHSAANYTNFEDESEKYNLKIHNIDFERNPLHYKNLIAYGQLKRLMEKEKFDVIHCNTPVGGVLGRISAYFTGSCKVIYTAHGFHYYNGAHYFKLVFLWAEMILGRLTDTLITINNEDYERAGKWKLRNDGTVYLVHGVGVNTVQNEYYLKNRDFLYEYLNVDNNSLFLISVGELNKNKNHHIVIKALAKMKQNNIHYLICGVGKEKNHLIKLSQCLGMEENIHFMDYHQNIMRLLYCCDIFILPSKREGLPRSIMEAMVAGLPCIVSNIRGNIDLITNGLGGLLINSWNMEDLLRAITYLVGNKKLRKAMGQYNQNEIKKFDVSVVESEIYKIYNEVL